MNAWVEIGYGIGAGGLIKGKPIKAVIVCLRCVVRSGHQEFDKM